VAEVSITQTGFAELQRKFDGADDVIDLEMRQTMDASLNIFHQLVDPMTPVFNGHLRAATTEHVFGTPAGGNFWGQLLNPMEYADDVENGRPPGQYSPIFPLEYWVRRKLGIPFPGSLARAFQISATHKEKGRKGVKMFERAFKQGKPRVEQLWQGIDERIARKIE